jgi:hypothetical protein
MSYKKKCSCQTNFKLTEFVENTIRVRRVWWMKMIPSSKLYKCKKCYGRYMVINSIHVVITYKRGLYNLKLNVYQINK